jgi:hypothetical protein
MPLNRSLAADNGDLRCDVLDESTMKSFITVILACLFAVAASYGQGERNGAASAQSDNGIYNPLLAPGAALDDQVSWIEANSCAAGRPCTILLPAGQAAQTFTNGFRLGNNTTFQCASPMGYTAREVGSDTAMNLTYNGSGTAITLAGINSKLVNCHLRLGNTAKTGVVMSGDGSRVEDSQIAGGGTSTTLLHISGGTGSALVEDARVTGSKLFGFVGNAVVIDHANDAQLTCDVAYGVSGNTTSHTITIDTQADGTTVDDFKGGDSGEHGLVVQNTLGGSSPAWIFVHDFEADCSTGGDGWVFDRSLGTDQVNFAAVDSWAAGAGQNCTTRAVVTSTAHGIHISGGHAISISQTRVRANAANGILIDSANVADVQITGNEINGNNWTSSGPNGSYDGIRVGSIAAARLIFSGNVFDNEIEGKNGHQLYGIAVETGPTQVTVANNVCGTSVLGCISLATSNADAWGNVSADRRGNPLNALTGLQSYGARFTPLSSSSSHVLYGTNPAGSAVTWAIDAAGNLSTVGTVTADGLPTGCAQYPCEVAKFDAAAQTSNLSGTLYTVPAGRGGDYWVSCYTVVTHAATISSTLPYCGVRYTDEDAGVVALSNNGSAVLAAGASNSQNIVGATGKAPSSPGVMDIRVAAGTAISYATQGYASSGTTAMQYAVHYRLIYVGP